MSNKEAKEDEEKQNREKKDEADNVLENVKPKSAPVVNASLVLLYAVLAGMFITGWVSLNSCPLNKMIPIYLIVAGSTGILTKALLQTRNKYLFNVVLILIIFDISWQALGSYVVYKEYQPNYDPLVGPYCNRHAYLLAFWMLTLNYSLTGLFLLLSGCYFLMRNSFKKA